MPPVLALAGAGGESGSAATTQSRLLHLVGAWVEAAPRPRCGHWDRQCLVFHGSVALVSSTQGHLRIRLTRTKSRVVGPWPAEVRVGPVTHAEPPQFQSHIKQLSGDTFLAEEVAMATQQQFQGCGCQSCFLREVISIAGPASGNTAGHSKTTTQRPAGAAPGAVGVGSVQAHTVGLQAGMLTWEPNLDAGAARLPDRWMLSEPRAARAPPTPCCLTGLHSRKLPDRKNRALTSQDNAGDRSDRDLLRGRATERIY